MIWCCCCQLFSFCVICLELRIVDSLLDPVFVAVAHSKTRAVHVKFHWWSLRNLCCLLMPQSTGILGNELKLNDNQSTTQAWQDLLSAEETVLPFGTVWYSSKGIKCRFFQLLDRGVLETSTSVVNLEEIILQSRKAVESCAAWIVGGMVFQSVFVVLSHMTLCGIKA